MKSYIARQPILDRQQLLVAYELLYRAGPTNSAVGADQEIATSSVLDQSMLSGDLASLTGGHLAFINLTERALTGDLATGLPKSAVVLEILESVRPSPVVLDAIRRHKELGYRIALDDFTGEAKFAPIISLADYVKVDWRGAPRDRRAHIVYELVRRRIPVLAEKVETWDEFREAEQLGCQFFQGYFFSTPEMLRRQALPAGKQIAVRLLAELNRPTLDFDSIEPLIKSDLSFSFRLLRYINSSAFGLRQEVSSIRHALVLLGEREFRRWANIAVLSALGDQKSNQLVVAAAVRGRMCELLARELGVPDRDQELFLLGLLSLLDAFLDQPLAELVRELPVSNDIRQALGGTRNRLGNVLAFTSAYERGNFTVASALATKLNVHFPGVADSYLDALQWADQLIGHCDDHGAAA